MVVGVTVAHICSKIHFGLYFDVYGMQDIESSYTEVTLSMNCHSLSDRHKIQNLTFSKL